MRAESGTLEEPNVDLPHVGFQSGCPDRRCLEPGELPARWVEIAHVLHRCPGSSYQHARSLPRLVILPGSLSPGCVTFAPYDLARTAGGGE